MLTSTFYPPEPSINVSKGEESTKQIAENMFYLPNTNNIETLSITRKLKNYKRKKYYNMPRCPLLNLQCNKNPY